MLAPTNVRTASDAAVLSEVGPRGPVPFGHLLADTLSQGDMRKTSTHSMTGPPEARDEDDDDDPPGE